MKNENAVALGKRGGSIGGFARAESLTPEQRKEIASKAAQSRWSKTKEKELSFDDLLGGNFEELAIKEVSRCREEIIRLQNKISKLENLIRIDLNNFENNWMPSGGKGEAILEFLKSRGCPATISEITKEIFLKGFRSSKGEAGLRCSIQQFLYKFRIKGMITCSNRKWEISSKDIYSQEVQE